MMLTCFICGKKFFTAYPQNWPYRMMQKVFCSEDCRIVHKARDLHKFEYVTLEAPELQGYAVKDMQYLKEKQERKKAEMARYLTEEQQNKAVEIALEGGNPVEYLKECGCKNQWASWGYIKQKLEKKDPEKYKRVIETLRKTMDKKGEEKQEKKAHEYAGEGQVKVSSVVENPDGSVTVAFKDEPKNPKPLGGGEWEKAAVPEPVLVMKEEKKPKAELKYKVIGIETEQGKFQFDAGSDQMRWMPKRSTTVVMMPAEDWAKLAEDLPGIMKTIGATDREADNE